MRIYMMGEQAFVDVGGKYMLCIGSKQEANEADEKHLVEMVHSAIVWSKFRAIEATRGMTLH